MWCHQLRGLSPCPAAAAAMGKFSTFHTFVTVNIPDFTACCSLIGTSLTALGLFMQLKTITRGHPCPAKVVVVSPAHGHLCRATAPGSSVGVNSQYQTQRTQR